MNINEKALCALIKKQPFVINIVNVKDDNFEYCNGYMMAICGYSCHEVIQKLFKVEAINNYRQWKPERSAEMTRFYTCTNEVSAEKTPYLKTISSDLANIFQINGKYYLYNKKYVDVFKDAIFKADIEPEVPVLRAYDDDKFLGVVLAIRNTEKEYMHNLILGMESNLETK